MNTSTKNIPKLAIFDMDGILFNTEELFMEHKNKYLKQFGYPARKEDYIRTLGTRGATLNAILVDIYGKDYPAEEISSLTRNSVRQHIEQYGLEVKPGIPELLQFFKDRNVLCMVASSTTTATVKNYLHKSNIDSFFSVVIGGDMVSNSKPDPEIFLKAFDRHSDYIDLISPSEAVIFEDSENGILAANAASIPCICIPDLIYPKETVASLPVAILPSAFDVIDYLTSEN